MLLLLLDIFAVLCIIYSIFAFYLFDRGVAYLEHSRMSGFIGICLACIRAYLANAPSPFLILVFAAVLWWYLSSFWIRCVNEAVDEQQVP